MAIREITTQLIQLLTEAPDLSRRVNSLIETVHVVGVRIIGTAIDAGNSSIRTLIRYKFEILLTITLVPLCVLALLPFVLIGIPAVGLSMTMAILLATLLAGIVLIIAVARFTPIPPRLDGTGTSQPGGYFKKTLT